MRKEIPNGEVEVTRIETKHKCNDCNGTGKQEITCPWCKGTGVVREGTSVYKLTERS